MNSAQSIDPLYERTAILVGDEGLERLRNTRVLVAGLGGVGGAAAEALARAGGGRLTLLDHDTVAPSNLNRQIVALHSTLGRGKTAAMAERLRDINPAIDLDLHTAFLQPQDAADLVAEPFDYVLDCIDSIACKAALVLAAQQAERPVISSMGAGGRLDPTRIHVATLNQTSRCGLAREMRKTLKRLGGRLNYPVVYSDEEAIKGLAHQPVGGDVPGRPRAINGTISYLPALFGFTLAGYVIKSRLRDQPCDPS
ncbi:tRNA threonylcarbamoyladenosine dehydratase [Acidihalobacter ferrooxydans]|uniref:tRNA threonylcarbamoyladenosine dehydratase n=1 Tax=Acidihalobacter ferrooxydans TaxID=1765967 RepID=A0A1P8UK96_9GAMM|nr:tRNA threonylcarbamoyladenosine dehydratase [Acidihalobacter ferrooxydans]APZ44259.1 tRNA threonylcarbamoyladenosine dehydratase [Acidihalobacter ferrooxydans]